MSKPIGISASSDGTYYIYEDKVTSVHVKGAEPEQEVYLFGSHWKRDQGFYMWNNLAYLTWKKV